MTAEGTPRTFIENGLYAIHGIMHIVQEGGTTLVPVLGDRSNPITPSQDTHVEHFADPGSPEWVSRMTHLLTRCNIDLRNEQRSHADLRRWADGLKRAIYEVAVEKEWCDEYNEFADEWNLIPLETDYEVTVQFIISARSEDHAITQAKNNVTISLDLTRDPRFDADEV